MTILLLGCCCTLCLASLRGTCQLQPLWVLLLLHLLLLLLLVLGKALEMIPSSLKAELLQHLITRTLPRPAEHNKMPEVSLPIGNDREQLTYNRTPHLQESA